MIRDDKSKDIFLSILWAQSKHNKKIFEEILKTYNKRLDFAANTNLKKEFLKNLRSTGHEFLLWESSSEYSWLFGNSYYLDIEMTPLFKKLNVHFENWNFLRRGNFINENTLLLKRDNSATNMSPDFVFWDMKSGVEIGVEITSTSIVDPTKIFSDGRSPEDRGRKYTRRETMLFLNRIKMYSDMILEPKDILEDSLNILTKKAKLIEKDHWQTKYTILIIKLPMNYDILYFNTNWLKALLFEIESKNESLGNPFARIVISHVGYRFGHFKYNGGLVVKSIIESIKKSNNL